MATRTANGPTARNGAFLPESVQKINESLWNVAARSVELTVLYAVRWSGPRQSAAADAHSFWEISAIYGGKGYLHYDDHQVAMQRGSIALIPPQLAHRESATGRLDTLWLGLSGNRLNHLDHKRVHCWTDPAALTALEAVWFAAAARRPGSGWEIDALAQVAVARLLRLPEHLPTHDNAADALDAAITRLSQHYAQPLRVAELAATCGCSEGHFHRAFRKRTGTTPVAFVTAERLRQAMRLITASTMPLSAIAAAVGYADPWYFSRMFKRFAQCSPQTYRQRANAIG